MQKLTRTNKYPEPQKINKRKNIIVQHNITDFGLVARPCSMKQY